MRETQGDRETGLFFPNDSISFFSSFFTSNRVCHRGPFVRLLLYAVVHMGETNSDLEETIGKYIIVYLELHRKTVIHTAPYVLKFVPWASLMLEY